VKVNKLSKVAIAVIALNTSIYTDGQTQSNYLEDQDAYAEVNQLFKSGWHWGVNSALACGEDEDISRCYEFVYYQDQWYDSSSVGPGEGNDGGYDGYGSEGGSSGGGGGGNSSNEAQDGAEKPSYDPHTVMDVIVNLVALKDNLTRLLAVSGLSPEAKSLIRESISKLDNAIDKSNIYLNLLNTGAQAAAHAMEGDLGYAVAEVAALGVAFGVGIAVAGPGGVILGFAAGTVTELAIDTLVDEFGAIYDIGMYEYKNSEPFWEGLYCSGVRTPEYCEEP